MRITTINSIEVSAKCNLSCPYCAAKEQYKHREVGIMEMKVFDQALTWVSHYAKKATQLELNLFGVGEPLLNPHLAEMVRKARHALPLSQPVHLNTNGILMTRELAVKLRDAGITHMDITGHDPYHTAKTIRLFRQVGIKGSLSVDYMTQPNDWAGQVDWFKSEVTYPCPWLHRGQVMVMWNGDITRCCLDAFGTGILGTVWDDLETLQVTPFALCSSCHQTVPMEQREIISFEEARRYAVRNQ